MTARCIVIPLATPDQIAWSGDGSSLGMIEQRRMVLIGADSAAVRSIKLGFAASSICGLGGGFAVADADRTIFLDPKGRIRGRLDGGGTLAADGDTVFRLAAYHVAVIDGERMAVARRIERGGDRIVARDGRVAIASRGGVTILDAASGTVVDEIKPDGWVRSLGFGPDGVLVISTDGRTTWHHRGTTLRWIPESGAVHSFGERWIIGTTVVDDTGTPIANLKRLGGSDPGCVPAPDAKHIALLDGHLLQIIPTGEAIAPLPAGAIDRVTALAVSHSGREVAAITHDGQVVVWDVASRACVATFDAVGTWRNEVVAFSPAGDLLIPGERGISVWSWRERRRRTMWDAPALGRVQDLTTRDKLTLAVGDCAVVLDGSGAVIAGAGPFRDPARPDQSIHLRGGDLHPDGTVVVATHDDVRVCRPGAEPVSIAGRAVRFDHRGRWLAIGDGREARIRAWPLVGDEPVSVVPGFDDAVPHRDGFIATADNHITAVTAPSTVIWRSKFHDSIEAIAAAPDADELFTSGRRAWVGVRDVASGRLLATLPAGCGDRITALAFDPTGQHVAAGSADGRIQVWRLDPVARRGLVDPTSLQPEGAAIELGSLGEVHALAWLGPLVAVCAGRVVAWNDPLAVDLARTAPDRAFESLYPELASADGRRVASEGSWGRPASVYAIDTDAAISLGDFEVPGDRPRHTQLSPAGTTIVVGGTSGGTDLVAWSLEPRRRLASIHIDRELGGLAFVSEDEVVMWMDARRDDRDRPGVLARWTIATGEITRWLPDHGWLSRCSAVAFGGGRALFCGDGPARIVDLATGEVRVLARHRFGSIGCGAVSNDGALAITGDGLGELRLWAAATGELRAAFGTTTSGETWCSP